MCTFRQSSIPTYFAILTRRWRLRFFHRRHRSPRLEWKRLPVILRLIVVSSNIWQFNYQAIKDFILDCLVSSNECLDSEANGKAKGGVFKFLTIRKFLP